ncbi:hypothetical protein D3C81_2028510 [compost metagenome]
MAQFQLGLRIAGRVVPALAAEQRLVADQLADQQIHAFGDAGNQRSGHRLVDELKRAVADRFVDNVLGTPHVFEVAHVGHSRPGRRPVAPQAQTCAE